MSEFTAPCLGPGDAGGGDVPGASVAVGPVAAPPLQEEPCADPTLTNGQAWLLPHFTSAFWSQSQANHSTANQTQSQKGKGFLEM